ncbi:MAG TPA: hypothetical protein VGB18_02805 [Candidatus Thermoplasmatota archaeon]
MKAAFLLAAALLIASSGCLDSPRTITADAPPMDDDMDNHGPEGSFPQHTQSRSTHDLTEGAQGLHWTFVLNETANTGHILFYIALDEDALVRQAGDYCFKTQIPTEGHSRRGACSQTGGNLNVEPPVDVRETIFEKQAPFPAGEYLFNFDAPIQLDKLIVDIDVATD